MLKDQFLLNPAITFLNHGSFGACPRAVFKDYQKWQRLLEAEPVQFITKTGKAYLETSKLALSNYINCNAQDLVFVTNPTYAMNMVIKNLQLRPGDEILSTNHEYGAMDKTWNYYCEKAGAHYIQQKIDLPIHSKESFLKQFWAGLTPRTKVIFISHITSVTSLLFPVDEICKKAKALGILTIIDGAHVPGHIPLNISTLDPDIYTGACHKWLLCPKGNSFIYVKKERQAQFDPLIISWGFQVDVPEISVFQDNHQYNGTRDFSAFLTVPAALKFFEDNDWENEKKKCRELVTEYYPIIAAALDSSMLCPNTSEFLGQLSSIPLKTKDPLGLKDLLYTNYHIEIPIMEINSATYLRVSYQAYNNEKELIILLDALASIRKKTTLIN